MSRLERQNKPGTRLHGNWLLYGRIVWLVLAALSVGLFLLSLPEYSTQLHMICTSATSACALDGVLSLAGSQALHQLGISVDGYAWFTIVFTLFVMLVWTGVGMVIFWRRSDDWMALMVALFLVTFNPGLTSGPTSALAHFSLPWAILVWCVDFLEAVLVALFFFLFPSGRFVPRWTRWMIIPVIVQQSPLIFLPLNSPLNSNNWPAWLNGLIDLALVGSVIFSQIYRYWRVSTITERQQTKWIIFGTIIALAGFLALTVVGLLLPALPLQSGLYNIANDSLWFLFLLPIPLSIGVAMLRYRLYDIDVIINRTLVYSALTVSLALVYFGLIIMLQALVSRITGQVSQSPLVIVVSTLAIAALFQPLRKRIQGIIDRSFYRRKYDAASTLAAFSATLRNEVDLAQLSEHLLRVVAETMQPTHISLWLRPVEQDGKHNALDQPPTYDDKA